MSLHPYTTHANSFGADQNWGETGIELSKKDGDRIAAINLKNFQRVPGLSGGDSIRAFDVGIFDSRNKALGLPVLTLNTSHTPRFPGNTTVAPFSTKTVELGALCMNVNGGPDGNGGNKELCDYILAAVQAINNKKDGFFDNLLPDTQIIMSAAKSTCSSTLPNGAMEGLYTALPRMSGIIGPACSGTVKVSKSQIKVWHRFGGLLSFTGIHHTIPCRTIPCHAIPYHTIPYHACPFVKTTPKS